MSSDSQKQSKKHMFDNNQLSNIDCSLVLDAVSETAIVSITDSKGRITEVNDKFCEISGYSREELIGQDHRILNSGAHSKDFFREIWQTILSGKPWKGEIQNRKKSGEPYWVMSSISPVFNKQGEIDKFISIRFDVSDKYHIQNMLKHSAKTAVLGEMAAGIAHEINNPLAIILGRAVLLKNKITSTEINVQDCLNDLEKIEFVGERILKIIKGIKSFAKKTDNDPMELAPAKTLLDCVTELSRNITRKNNINLILGNVDEYAEIMCRPAQIEQVLLCLISNSCDAIKDTTNAWIRIDVEVKNEITLFKVTDSGQSIPEKVAQRLMQPFFTTKNEGTGLGLNIAKTIVEEHGGKLFYNSKSPNTQFVMEIPLASVNSENDPNIKAA